MERRRLDLMVEGVRLNIAAVCTASSSSSAPSSNFVIYPSTPPPLIFLHGFGSTKEDFVDLTTYPAFRRQKTPLIAYDAPGCGETECEDPSQVSIEFLVKTAEAVLCALGVSEFHLVGHSMGGLTALMLAHRNPARVLSFIDIKGNLAPEDCFLSRQIFSYPAGSASEFFDRFVERMAQSFTSRSSSLYAASLRHKVSPNVVDGIFRSMVELSDKGYLLDKFLGLPCPRLFMYGEEYASLSYLGQLRLAQGVELAEIPFAGHFPMYSNAPATWEAISTFLRRCDHDSSSNRVCRLD